MVIDRAEILVTVVATGAASAARAATLVIEAETVVEIAAATATDRAAISETVVATEAALVTARDATSMTEAETAVGIVAETDRVAIARATTDRSSTDAPVGDARRSRVDAQVVPAARRSRSGSGITTNSSGTSRRPSRVPQP
jgi:hypothetical protein